MTSEEIQAFLSEVETIQVASIGPQGWPHLVPMWFVLRDGQICFRSFTKSQKIQNLRRDPRLTLLAETGTHYAELRGVMIRARARLIDDFRLVLQIYGMESHRYAFVGSTPVGLEGEALEQAFGRFAAKNTVVLVEPVRITSWDHRKLAGTY